MVNFLTPVSPAISAYFDASTPEAQAHATVSAPDIMWDYSHTVGASLDEQILALAAAYLALNRYLYGNDIYIFPNTTQDLINILRRYSADAIHNFISMSRAQLRAGGYSRASYRANQSLEAMLACSTNAERLLGLHRRSHEPPSSPESTSG